MTAGDSGIGTSPLAGNSVTMALRGTMPEISELVTAAVWGGVAAEFLVPLSDPQAAQTTSDVNRT